MIEAEYLLICNLLYNFKLSNPMNKKLTVVQIIA